VLLLLKVYSSVERFSKLVKNEFAEDVFEDDYMIADFQEKLWLVVYLHYPVFIGRAATNVYKLINISVKLYIANLYFTYICKAAFTCVKCKDIN